MSAEPARFARHDELWFLSFVGHESPWGQVTGIGILSGNVRNQSVQDGPLHSYLIVMTLKGLTYSFCPVYQVTSPYQLSGAVFAVVVVRGIVEATDYGSLSFHDCVIVKSSVSLVEQ
jgi:hypothetical protein